jgi:hypothetical protein
MELEILANGIRKKDGPNKPLSKGRKNPTRFGAPIRQDEVIRKTGYNRL